MGVQIASVECNSNTRACERFDRHLRGFPRLIFIPSVNARSSVAYGGDFYNANAIKVFVGEYLKLNSANSASERTFGRSLVHTIKNGPDFRSLLSLHSNYTGLPVVVSIYRSSCVGCQVQSSRFEDLAKEFEGRVVLARFDTDTSPDAYSSLQFQEGLTGIPSFMFFGADGSFQRHEIDADEPLLAQLLTEMAESSHQ